MATVDATTQGELLSQLSSIANSCGGISSMPDDHTVTGRLTAIKAKWLLGERKVMNTFTCTLDPASHKAHFRESAVETSWGLPPPTFTVQTTSQFGTRVKETRVDKGAGGGGILEFGKFREEVEEAVKHAGWVFLYEVV
jgi:hypothetical protein